MTDVMPIMAAGAAPHTESLPPTAHLDTTLTTNNHNHNHNQTTDTTHR